MDNLLIYHLMYMFNTTLGIPQYKIILKFC